MKKIKVLKKIFLVIIIFFSPLLVSLNIYNDFIIQIFVTIFMLFVFSFFFFSFFVKDIKLLNKIILSIVLFVLSLFFTLLMIHLFDFRNPWVNSYFYRDIIMIIYILFILIFLSIYFLWNKFIYYLKISVTKNKFYIFIIILSILIFSWILWTKIWLFYNFINF